MDSKFDFNWSHWAGFKEHGGQVHMCKTLDHSVTRGLLQNNNQMLNDIHCGDTRRIAAFGFSDHHFFLF